MYWILAEAASSAWAATGAIASPPATQTEAASWLVRISTAACSTNVESVIKKEVPPPPSSPKSEIKKPVLKKYYFLILLFLNCF
jgi:hypothetical protein